MRTMMIDTVTALVIMALMIVTLLLVWLSLVLSSDEFAVSRVTRSSLNNKILEVQTDSELGHLVQHKRIDRIHRVQKMIADRSGTASACAFFRIVCNILSGVFVAAIAVEFSAPNWVVLIAGLFFTLIVAVISVLYRAHSPGLLRPEETMLGSARLLSLAVALTPFVNAKGRKNQRDHSTGTELSDDEELDRIQHSEGRSLVEQLVETPDFDPEVGEMLRNVLTLSDTLTREIMVPRTDMIYTSQNDTLLDLLQLCSRSGYSRIPVIGDDLDDLKGMAYLKDAVKATAFNPEARTRSITSICRDPMLVPESKPVDDLFHEMQRTRQHVAVVIDEYGGVAGLVTIEDAIEQIVGELEDEHDRVQHDEPRKVGRNEWRMPARTPITELEEIFEVDLNEDDVDTLYGLLTKLLGRVPIVGMSACTHGLRLTAVDSAGRRKKVSTILVQPQSDIMTNEGAADDSDLIGGNRDDKNDDMRVQPSSQISGE